MFNQLRQYVGWFMIILLVQLLCCYNVFGQTLLKARVDSVVMTIGDVNHIRVFIPNEQQVQVDWQVLQEVPSLSVLGEVERGKQGNETILSLPFSIYDSTQLMLPSIPVISQAETLYTNEVAVLVNFPKIDSTSLAYRPMVSEPFSWKDYTIYGYILVGLLILGIVLFMLLRAKPKVIQEQVLAPPPLPHELAFKALELLQVQNDWSDKQYYSELDRILRQYLWDRYEIPALERTNREITEIFEKRNLPQKEELPELLGQVDMVKFAKAKMPFEKRLASVDAVRKFVAYTKQLPEQLSETQDLKTNNQKK